MLHLQKNPTLKFVFEEHSGHSLTAEIQIETDRFKNTVKSVITGGVLLLAGRER